MLFVTAPRIYIVKIELIYIDANQKIHQQWLHLPKNTLITIEDAINQTHFFSINPDCAQYAVGIFGQHKPLNTILNNGDRIEFYRPLLMDPKAKRLLRAKQKH